MPIRMTYKQIAEDLTSRIAAGEYAPGDELPTYKDLAALYSVGMTTAARVYAVLNDRGVVVGQAGRRVYVAEKANGARP